MTLRRAAALLAVLVALAMLGLAALTPLRADRIAELDERAYELGREWTEQQGNQELAAESNRYFDEARALEPPVGPMMAGGLALLAGAAAVALWPAAGSGAARREDEEPGEGQAPTGEQVTDGSTAN